MSNCEVIVGSVGTVFSGCSPVYAHKMFAEYRELSLLCIGRAAGESVTLIRDGSIELQHFPDDCPPCPNCGGEVFTAPNGIPTLCDDCNTCEDCGRMLSHGCGCCDT